MTAIMLNPGRGTVHAVSEDTLKLYETIDWKGNPFRAEWHESNHPAGMQGWQLLGHCSDVDAREVLMAMTANKSRSLGFGGERATFPASFISAGVMR